MVFLGHITDQILAAIPEEMPEILSEPGMIGRLHGVVGKPGIEVLPVGGPDRGLEPWHHQINDRPIFTSGTGHLIKLKPIKALQPRIRKSYEACR